LLQTPHDNVDSKELAAMDSGESCQPEGGKHPQLRNAEAHVTRGFANNL